MAKSECRVTKSGLVVTKQGVLRLSRVRGTMTGCGGQSQGVLWLSQGARP